MPFLFIDYDQGAGGEFFCYELSQSVECVPLSGFTNRESRTKINDVFGQEFLKIVPRPDVITAHASLYDVIPSHRNTNLAQLILKNVYSIRIASPVNNDLWQYLKYQQITKVFKSQLPSGKHFVGEIEMLSRATSDKSWIKQVKSSMDNLTVLLLSRNIDPTEENKNKFIQEIIANRDPEPNYNFDLVIPYEDLFYNTSKIKEQIKSIFEITVVGDWLEKYKKDYDAYLVKT